MLDKEGHVKLIDFGFAKKLTAQTQMRTNTNCGTVGYTAPEVISEGAAGYSFAADVWCFGITLCELLTGNLPFEDRSDPMQINQAIISGEIRYSGIDATARDLLTQIFVTEPNLRISLDAAMHHKNFAPPGSAQETRSFWKSVGTKSYDEVPFIPQGDNYQLQEKESYPLMSNLCSSPNQSGAQTA